MKSRRRLCLWGGASRQSWRVPVCLGARAERHQRQPRFPSTLSTHYPHLFQHSLRIFAACIDAPFKLRKDPLSSADIAAKIATFTYHAVDKKIRIPRLGGAAPEKQPHL
ncbi:hypothetical protein EV356DRAFT_508847, partial [Viridothelium virens]